MMAGVLCGACIAHQAGAGSPDVPDNARLVALITDTRLAEISGMAASRRHPGVLWMHNDGDNPAELYAVDTHGKVRAVLAIDGVHNRDWEDLASFESEGRAWLVIGDTGDNGGLRKEMALHIVEEPGALQDARIAPQRTIRFRYADGPRDCEAVAVDVVERAIYLVSKKRVPPELFRLPLDAPAGTVLIAEPVGVLAGVEQPTAADLKRNPVYGRYRAQITALDISADGRRLAALNYLAVHLWERDEREDWATATRRPPRRIDYPWLAQAEALGFAPDNRTLWLGTEKLPAPLLRIEDEPAPLGTAR